MFTNPRRHALLKQVLLTEVSLCHGDLRPMCTWGSHPALRELYIIMGRIDTKIVFQLGVMSEEVAQVGNTSRLDILRGGL